MTLNAQILSVASYLTDCANSMVVERTRNGETHRSSGVLKIYMESKHIGRNGGVSLSRLAEYLGQFGITREVIAQAICSLSPIAGSGSKPNIVLVSPERREKDKRDAANMQAENRRIQDAFYRSIFDDAGIIVHEWTMPVFKPVETLQ